MLNVHFINKSSERVTLYQDGGGGILRILEPGKRWNRDPAEGTLRTVTVFDEDMKFPPLRPGPKWIDETEWVWDECPEGEIYAPFRTIVFEDNNVVKLKRRPRWKAPEMKWPVVEFLFLSHKMKIYQLHLDRDLSTSARVFYAGIPVRLTVDPLSRYAGWKRWIFDEELILKDVNPPFKNMKQVYQSTERGEGKRSATELERIVELKAKDEERQKLGMF